MAIIVDWTTLSAAVESYLDRPELTAMTPNFIEAAEKLVYRKVKHRGVETEFTATLSSGALAISGLTNFREMKWMRTSASGGSFIRPMSIENLYRKYSNRSEAVAFPKHYARDGASFIFGPAAADIAVDGVYWSLLPKLQASNTTNWFTANAPEVLLYGALLQAEPFIVGDARIPVWGALFKAQFDAVQEEGKAENKTGSSRAIQID